MRSYFSVVASLVFFGLSYSVGHADVLDDYSSFGLGDYRQREYGGLDAYDPYTGTWRFAHVDAVVPLSSDLSVVIQRTLSESNYAGSRVADWNIHFGRVATDASWTDRTVCEEARKFPFITMSGAVKQFFPARPDRFGGSGYVSKDGWKMYCWGGQGSLWPDPGNIPDNPRGREEAVVVSPNGTKYIMGEYGKWDFSSEEQILVSRIESASGAFFDINYNTRQNLRDGSYPEKDITYIDSISLSDGTIIDFKYINEGTAQYNTHSGVYRKGEDVYDVWILDRIEYEGRVLSEYNYYLNDGDIEWNNLESVNLPGDKSWVYGQGTFIDARDTEFTSPYGVTAIYERYFDIVNGSDRAARRVTYSSAGRSIVKSFNYDNNSPKHSDFTQVIVGESCVEYRHSHKGSVATAADLYIAGSVEEIRKYSDSGCSTLAEKQSFMRERYAISNQNVEINRPSGNDDSYPYTEIPLLTEHRVEVYNEGGVDVFTTAYSDFDDFANAQTITETFSSSGYPSYSRITRKTFENNVDAWVVGLVATQKVDGIAGELSYVYRSETGQLSSNNEYGRVNSYTYDSDNNVRTHENPLNKVTTYSNYKKGTPQTIDYPEEYTVSKAVDNFGLVESYTDSGRTIHYEYDDAGRITKIVSPDGYHNVDVTYTNNSKGVLQTVITGSHVETFQYDVWGNLIEKTLNVGEPPAVGGSTLKWSFEFDDHNRPTFQSFANSVDGYRYTYDGIGRILTKENTTNSAITEYHYLNGNRKAVVDPEGVRTVQTFQSYGDPNSGALIRIADDSAASASANIEISSASDTVLQRNKIGLLESVTRDSVTHTYTYDTTWQLNTLTTPEVGTIDYDYDLAGNLIGRTMPGYNKTTYGYDALNRLSSINYADPDTPDESLTYYSNSSHVKTQTKGSLTWTYTYSPNLELMSETLTDSTSGKSWVYRYGYDAYGNVKEIEYPSGNIISYFPDSIGRSKKIVLGSVDIVKNIHYQADQFYLKPTKLYFGNGVVETLEFTDIGQVDRQTITKTGLGPFIDRNYDYDLRGVVHNISEGPNTIDPFSIGLTHDQLGQLLTVTGPDWVEGVATYDTLGNITRKSFGELDLDYSYDANNRLTKVENFNSLYRDFVYNAAGSVTNNSRYQFEYGEDQLMRAAGDTAPDDYLYVYDARGRRAKTVEAGSAVSYYIYASSGRLMTEQRTNGEGLEYYYFGNKLVASEKSCTDADADNNGIADCAEQHYNGAFPDVDNDGLTNSEEMFLSFTDVRNADTDGDTLLDGEEVNEHHSDPHKADTDLDRMTDPQEVNGYQRYNGGKIYTSEPNSADTDGDGLEDGTELLEYGSLDDTLIEEDKKLDPRNPDSDGDGLLDGIEVNTYSTNPEVTDTDRDTTRLSFQDDGAHDGQEVNQLGTSPLLLDTDGDCIWDGHEVNGVVVGGRSLEAIGTSPLNPNTSAKGFSDYYYLYAQEELFGEEWMQANPDYQNHDRFQQAFPVPTDHCGPAASAQFSDFWGHADNDGVPNGHEYYYYGSDPTKDDTDGDGRVDGFEVYPRPLPLRTRVWENGAVSYQSFSEDDLASPIYIEYGDFQQVYSGDEPNDVNDPLGIGVTLLSPLEKEENAQGEWLTNLDGYQLDYSYFIDGSLQRDWTNISLPPAADRTNNDFYISLNTVDLAPALAIAGRNAIHMVQFRMTDQAGNATFVNFKFKVVVGLNQSHGSIASETIGSPFGSELSTIESQIENQFNRVDGAVFTNKTAAPVIINIAETGSLALNVRREAWDRRNVGWWQTRKEWKVFGADACEWKDLSNGTYYDVVESVTSSDFSEVTFLAGGTNAEGTGYFRTKARDGHSSIYPYRRARSLNTVSVSNEWYNESYSSTVNQDEPSGSVSAFNEASNDQWGVGRFFFHDGGSHVSYYQATDLYRSQDLAGYDLTSRSPAIEGVITQTCPKTMWGDNYILDPAAEENSGGQANATYGFYKHKRFVPDVGYPKNVRDDGKNSVWNWGLNTRVVVVDQQGTETVQGSSYFTLNTGESIKIYDEFQGQNKTFLETVNPVYSETRYKDVQVSLTLTPELEIQVRHANGLSSADYSVAQLPYERFILTSESITYTAQ